MPELIVNKSFKGTLNIKIGDVKRKVTGGARLTLTDEQLKEAHIQKFIGLKYLVKPEDKKKVEPIAEVKMSEDPAPTTNMQGWDAHNQKPLIGKDSTESALGQLNAKTPSVVVKANGIIEVNDTENKAEKKSGRKPKSSMGKKAKKMADDVKKSAKKDEVIFVYENAPDEEVVSSDGDIDFADQTIEKERRDSHPILKNIDPE